jgi:two-component system, LytTR family, response regulator
VHALIVDDERIARQELRRLLAVHPDVEIVAEARHADEAEDLLERHEPDLLFLDIQMPGRSGLEMLERFPDPPQTILTTAFDRYALRGFELNAVDYLLKPIVPERLSEALRRVRQRLDARSASQASAADSSAAPPAAHRPLEQVFVRDGERCWLVRLDEISLLRSEGNYTRVIFAGNQPLIPRSLAQIEPRLDPSIFFRANRAEVLNLRRVVAVTPEADGYVISLRGGPDVVVSRRQAKLLRDLLAL